jgi:hypothetical protein
VRAAKEITDRGEGPVEKRVVIENVPEFQQRVRLLTTMVAVVNRNIYAVLCKPNEWACLTPEQMRAELLHAFPEQARPMVEQELALLD